MRRIGTWLAMGMAVGVVACSSDPTFEDGETSAGAGATGTQGAGGSGAQGTGGNTGNSGASSPDGGAGTGGEGGAGPLLWSHAFGDDGMQFGQKVAVDSQGRVAVAVQFSSTIDLGGGELVDANDGGVNGSMAVAVFDPDGTYLWGRPLGVAGQGPGNTGEGLDVDFDSADNLVVYGSFIKSTTFGGETFNASPTPWGDAFVAKYDPGGNHLWSKHFAAPETVIPTDLALDAFDHIVIAGTFCGPLDLGGGPLPIAPPPEGGGACGDVFVGELDAAGNHLFSKSIGNGYRENNPSLAVNRSPGSTGDITIVSGSSYSIDLSGFGAYDFGTNGGIWMLTLGGTGAYVSHGIVPSGVATSALATKDGAIYVAGLCPSELDFGSGPLGSNRFLARYQGPNLAFAKGLSNEPRELALGPSSGVVVSGSTAGQGGAPFVAGYDETGAELWSTVFAGAQGSAAGVATDASGNQVYLAGGFSDQIDLGSGPLTSAGNFDAFLATFPGAVATP